MADVRIDTNEIEVVSAKDNNQKMQDIAEVVDSSNPFVANGQSKVLKHNNQYYLTTNPNYNWYKEVAQGCFAYKDGSNEITEKISAKGYRPRLNSNDVKYNFDFNTRGAYKIVIGKNENGLYATHISGTGDNYKEETSQIVNSSGVNSFYLLVHSQGGSGGNSSDLNGKAAGGGGSGCCTIMNITVSEPEATGDLITIEQHDGGTIQIYAGTNDTYLLHLLTPGMQGNSTSTGLWADILGFILTLPVGAAGWWVPEIQSDNTTNDSYSNISVDSITAKLGVAVNDLNDSIRGLSAGSGGILLKCDSLIKGSLSYSGIPAHFRQVYNANGISSGLGSKVQTVNDNPESIIEFRFAAHSAGSTGSNKVAYKGGKGGAASLFASGGRGGNATLWTGGRGSSGSRGSGGGGAAGGMAGNGGGTGGNALIQLYW